MSIQVDAPARPGVFCPPFLQNLSPRTHCTRSSATTHFHFSVKADRPAARTFLFSVKSVLAGFACLLQGYSRTFLAYLSYLRPVAGRLIVPRHAKSSAFSCDLSDSTLERCLVKFPVSSSLPKRATFAAARDATFAGSCRRQKMHLVQYGAFPA